MSREKPSANICKRPVTVEGRTFPSLSDAARAFGINPQTAGTRLQRGWPPERVFATPVSRQAPPIAVEVEGRKFPSLNAAARHYGLKVSVVFQLRQQGLSSEEAVKEALRRQEAKSQIKANRTVASTALRSARAGLGPAHGLVLDPRAALEMGGKCYPNLRAACDAYGTTYDRVRRRLLLGWSVEQALGAAAKPVRVRMIHSVTVKGVEYPSMMHAAKALGISWGTFRARLLRGYSPEQAAGLEPGPQWPGAAGRPQTIEIAGRVFGSREEAARHFKLSSHTLGSRLRNGWTPEQAVGLARAPYRRRGPKPKPVIVRGVQYPSLGAACERIGLHRTTVVDRIRRGWSLEKALNTPSSPRFIQ